MSISEKLSISRAKPQWWRRAERTLLAVVVVGIALPACGANPEEEQQATDAPAPAPLNVFAGQVVDYDGKPVPDAKVVVAHAEDGFISYAGSDMVAAYAPDKKLLLFFTARNGKGSGETTTDAEGRFRFEGLRPGDYNLLAVHVKMEEPMELADAEAAVAHNRLSGERSSRGIAVLTHVQQPSQDNPLTVKLERPTWIKGNLRGLPSSDTERTVDAYLDYSATYPWFNPERDKYPRVYAHPPVIRDTEGNFKLGPLPCGGEWQLLVSQYVPKLSFGATLLAVPIKVEAGGTATFNLDLTKGPQLTGQVLDPEGKPAEHVAVTLKTEVPADSDASATQYGALSGKDGKYTIRGAPEGKYELTAQRWAPRTGPG